MLFPQAPKVKTTADYIAQVFTLFVVSMLMLIMVAVILIEAFNPESDTTNIVEAESELLKLIVGALIGYIAGRGAALETVQRISEDQAVIATVGRGERPPSVIKAPEAEKEETP